ncbi:hypothetical protein TNCV_2316021 [Trichonephila clavipes]|nr:hypothetical protein TNCV_2316021 [Trichonephila clavipes]
MFEPLAPEQRRGFGILDSEITHLQEFSVLCGLMVIGESRKDLASKKDLVCRAELVSISKSPDQRRRRIPCDFQRTSLAGLALDSATSSGLGRVPHSAMQDPIQAPPGTTRQAGLYTS